MAAPPTSSQLQPMLQSAVKAVQWTYSLFWQFCPQQGILVWADGYYNGAIKTRKTVQPMEVSAEEASLHRSQQLRELYDSLSAGESNQPAHRPCAALSPEDLTESEWFYLMCVSFSFPPGLGLPGRAYAKRQHVWLAGANEVDSKVFSRAILAKSARIQTVVCIPLMDGVVELGTTDRVQEDLSFVQHIKTFFVHHQLHHHHLPPPKPALSGHSTSNPAPTTSSDHAAHFHSPPVPAIYAAADPGDNTDHVDIEEEDEEEEEEEEEEAESDSEAETGRNSRPMSTQNPQNQALTSAGQGTAAELMQLEMSEDIRIGSPDDASNTLESDFHMMGVSQVRRAESLRAESTRRWQAMQDSFSNGALQAAALSGAPPQLEELTQEDTHYSQTVSTILHHQSTRWSESSPGAGCLCYSPHSAFSKWTIRSDLHIHVPVQGTSQWLLKYVLFNVPFLHSKNRDENSPKSRDPAESAARFRNKGTAQDELSANHVLAERRRREKLNERFIILRSLVPFVTKMDKASILGDTIEYVKQLRKKIQDLEARARQMETEHARLMETRSGEMQRSSGLKDQSNQSGATVVDRARVAHGPGPGLVADKRKVRVVEGSGCAKAKVVESPQSLPPPADMLQVSIIESDALVELHCPYKEGLLLDVMVTLRELRVEVTAVQSSLNNGFFTAELRAKVKENVNGKKASIVEVKRAINQIVPHTDS